MRCSREEFEDMVREAVDEVPDVFRPYLENLRIDVEDMPSRADCDAADVDDPRSLLGLYHGTPLTERSVEHMCRFPERIAIYQSNIQRMGRNRRQIVRQIRKTVLHEIGHHFGLDEDDLSELGYG
mgnify:CR=1 FL=1